MRLFKTISVSTVVILSAVLTLGPVSAQGSGSRQPGIGLPPMGPVPVSTPVQEAMIAGIMDEINAYNIYQGIIDQFGKVRPFTNIQHAELNHINAWKVLFERYAVTLPEPSVVVPTTFTNLGEACTAAADAEIANMALYDQMTLTLKDYPDMLQVIKSLRGASQDMHLPAFLRCAR